MCVYICIYHIDVYRFWKIKQLRNMKQVDPESIRGFKKCGVLLKWTHNNGDMNLSEVIMYFIVDSVINVLSIYHWDHDPKRNVWTIVESFWFNKERLILLIKKHFSFILVIWAIEKEVNSCFNMLTAVVKWV